MVAVVFALAAVCLRSESQKTDLRDTVNRLENEKADIAGERDALQQKLAAQQTSLTLLAGEKSDLRAKVNRLEGDKTQLAQERNDQTEEVARLTAINTSLTQKHNDLLTTVSRLKTIEITLTTENDEIKKDLAQLREEHELLQKDYKELWDRYHRLIWGLRSDSREPQGTPKGK